jgi:hypothetical protein
VTLPQQRTIVPLLELIFFFNLQSGVGKPNSCKERRIIDTREVDQKQTIDPKQMSSETVPILPEIRFDIPALTISNRFVKGAEISNVQQLTAMDNTEASPCINYFLFQFGVTFVAESDPFRDDWPFW